MLEFSEILKAYPEYLWQYERAILREYLQMNILQGIFESKYTNKLSFLGGTALRIFHGNNRFSEDINLDNFGLTWEEFEQVIASVDKYLNLIGFNTEMRNLSKGAYHCYIRFPEILHKTGLSPLPGEKILIQIDTISQGYEYQPELLLLNKLDVFTEIKITPLNILLSQKIYAAINRKRPKGRDFYDITFLAGITQPDPGFLKLKLGVENLIDLQVLVHNKITTFNFDELAKDVAPFLINEVEIQRVRQFEKFWDQIDFSK